MGGRERRRGVCREGFVVEGRFNVWRMKRERRGNVGREGVQVACACVFVGVCVGCMLGVCGRGVRVYAVCVGCDV